MYFCTSFLLLSQCSKHTGECPGEYAAAIFLFWLSLIFSDKSPGCEPSILPAYYLVLKRRRSSTISAFASELRNINLGCNSSSGLGARTYLAVLDANLPCFLQSVFRFFTNGWSFWMAILRIRSAKVWNLFRHLRLPLRWESLLGCFADIHDELIAGALQLSGIVHLNQTKVLFAVCVGVRWSLAREASSNVRDSPEIGVCRWKEQVWRKTKCSFLRKKLISGFFIV